MPVTDTNYNSTLALTDVVNNNAAFNATLGYSDAVDNRGMGQGALYTLLNNIVTNVNALNAKLDADGGVSDTNYASLHNLTALASQGYGLSVNGMHQKDLQAALAQIETNFNAILTKLDSDGGVTDTNYNALHAVDLNDTTSTGQKGLSQALIVAFLDSFVTQFNAALTKLDND